jgi:hypothetical protein
VADQPGVAGWDAPPPGPLPEAFWPGADPRLPEPVADWQASPIDPFGDEGQRGEFGPVPPSSISGPPAGERPARTRRERREQLARMHGEDTHEIDGWEYRAPSGTSGRRSRRHHHEPESHHHFWDTPDDLSTLPPPPSPWQDEGVGPRSLGDLPDETAELSAVGNRMLAVDATQELGARRELSEGYSDGSAEPAWEPEAAPEADGAIPDHPEGGDKSTRGGWARGSHVGIRIFAVGLLVVGVGAGVATHVLNGTDADTVKVSDDLAAAPADSSLPTSGADTGRSQGDQVGSALLDYSRQQAAVNAAQAQARKKAASAQVAADARAARAERSRASRSSDRSTEGTGGEQPPATPVSCSSYSGNRETGCSLLSWAGFSTSQMSCLDKLWTRESQWTTTAENSSSGAYGIPQALPASKMAEYGSDYRTNPVPQIKWGLNYIKGRYGTPCDAWNHSENTGWY